MSRALRTLAVAGLLVLAGCAGGPTTTTPDDPQTTATTTGETPVTETATTPATTTGVGDGGYYRSYTVQAFPVSLGNVAREVVATPAELDDDEAALLRAIAENGSASRVRMDPRRTRVGFGGDLVAVNGSYYRVNATVTRRENVTAHLVHADGPLANCRVDGDLDSYRERAVNYSDLGAADRRAVAATLGIAGDPGSGCHGIGYWYHFANGTVPENATLADGDTHVVRYEDRLWKIQLDPGRTSEQIRYEVSYTLDPVAANESAWREYVRAQNVTSLENASVSSAARDVLRRAVENGTVEWEGTTETEPAGFEDLAAAGRVYYVVQDGTIYKVTVQKVME